MSNDVMREITERIATEGRLRSEARIACLEAVKKAAKENNSGTAHVFAQAYEKLKEAPPSLWNGGLQFSPVTQMPPPLGLGVTVPVPQVGPDGVINPLPWDGEFGGGTIGGKTNG